MTGNIRKLAVAVAVALPFMAIVAVLWPFAWDDGAITIGFARNLAQHGILAPGPHSDPVEGYSTFLWMMIGTIPFVLGAGPDTAIDLMKFFTMAITLANAFIVHRLMRRHLASSMLRWAGTLLFLYSSVSILEANNGMETPLFLTLTLASIMLGERRDESRSRRNAFAMATSVLALVRFESPFYLVPYVIADLRREGLAAIRRPYPWVWFGVLVAYNVWHYWYFGELLPNTVIAKQNLIYSPGVTPLLPYLVFHAKPIFKLIVMFLPIVAWGLIAASRPGQNPGGVKAKIDRPALPIELWLTIAVGLALNTLIGNNSGPWNRMTYPMLPLLLLVALRAVEASSNTFLQSGRVVVVAVATTIMLNLAWVPAQTRTLASVVRAREVVDAVNLVQAASGVAPLTLACPDMGGTILFANDLRIIDTGLLCNRRLAREGLEGVARLVIHDERCDIIETHGQWTSGSRINEDHRLYDDYKPVWVGAIRLLIRNDLVDRLVARKMVAPVTTCGDIEPRAGFEADAEINRRFNGCLRFIEPAIDQGPPTAR